MNKPMMKKGIDTRELGRLRINSNGEVEFRATNYHDGDTIDFSINVIATDGDLDTSSTPLNITITDEESSAVSLKATTFEDAVETRQPTQRVMLQAQRIFKMTKAVCRCTSTNCAAG